jgi:hypothetical protein
VLTKPADRQGLKRNYRIVSAGLQQLEAFVAAADVEQTSWCHGSYGTCSDFIDYSCGLDRQGGATC